MGTLIKKVFTRPMPNDATIVTRKGKQIAQWTDRKGKKRSAELTENGQRIKTEATTWTAKYRDGEGVVQEVATGCKDKQAAAAVLKDLTDRAELVKPRSCRRIKTESATTKKRGLSTTSLPTSNISAIVDEMPTTSRTTKRG